MSEPPADAETFLAATDKIAALRSDLSPLEAGLLAGLSLKLAADTRSFARVFALEHALVLRALEILVDLGLLAATARNARTQRCHYEATEEGQMLLRALRSEAAREHSRNS